MTDMQERIGEIEAQISLTKSVLAELVKILAAIAAAIVDFQRRLGELAEGQDYEGGERTNEIQLANDDLGSSIDPHRPRCCGRPSPYGRGPYRSWRGHVRRACHSRQGKPGRKGP